MVVVWTKNRGSLASCSGEWRYVGSKRRQDLVTDSTWARKGRDKPLLVTSMDFQGKRSEVEAFLELAAHCQADSVLDRAFTR